MADYLPTTQAELTTWVGLQQRQRAATATALGLSQDEVDALDAADAAVLTSFATAADQQAKARAAVTQNETDVAAYKKRRRQEIARFKTDPRYSEALGRANEWIGDAPAVDPTTLKPTLKTVPSAEGIRLDWSKNGQDGVEVFRRLAGTPTWEKLAFDSRSPYIDTETDLTGSFEYYVQLLKADRPVGQPSDIVVARHGSR
jgi:hypothetical protein